VRCYDWLRELFHEVTPPGWMDPFARFPWQCVWTLNADDSFEQAYGRVMGEGSRAIRRVNWDDQFSMTRDLSVVHLHGKVDKEEVQRLVFSLSDYAEAAVAGAAWPTNFRDNYGIAPFVIVGARIRDEPDIEAVVARSKPAHTAPTFYVNRSISETAAEDFRSWNVIPIKMTGEEFIAAWTELIGMDLTSPPAAREEIGLRVGRQFVDLRTDQAGKVLRGHGRTSVKKPPKESRRQGGPRSSAAASWAGPPDQGQIFPRPRAWVAVPTRQKVDVDGRLVKPWVTWFIDCATNVRLPHRSRRLGTVGDAALTRSLQGGPCRHIAPTALVCFNVPAAARCAGHICTTYSSCGMSGVRASPSSRFRPATRNRYSPGSA
jgi:hypothetical protein